MSINKYSDQVQLNVWVSWALRKRWKQAAKHRGVSQSELARRALMAYLKHLDTLDTLDTP
jgi:hypothetical protein